MGGLSCKAKAILNGGMVQSASEKLCYLIDETDYDALTDDQWAIVIKQLNAAEDSMFKAQRAYLEALGFNGPWPKSLS